MWIGFFELCTLVLKWNETVWADRPLQRPKRGIKNTGGPRRNQNDIELYRKCPSTLKTLGYVQTMVPEIIKHNPIYEKGDFERIDKKSWKMFKKSKEGKIYFFDESKGHVWCPLRPLIRPNHLANDKLLSKCQSYKTKKCDITFENDFLLLVWLFSEKKNSYVHYKHIYLSW